jgi:hydroxymethylpyrimidine pyrophosphatase-like HAD family hydrolase
MAPNNVVGVSHAVAWQHAQNELLTARRELASAEPGIAFQAQYNRLLDAQRLCTALVHTWLAEALHLERVVEPRLVFSLDVDGVLEEEAGEGFSATGLTGAMALRLLQLGGVAVILNTGRSQDAVRDRVSQFGLLGGVASFGGAVWDNVFHRGFSLLSDRGDEQLSDLREILRAQPRLVQDSSHTESVRVSRVSDGSVVPLPGAEARALLDRNGFTDLTFWVAPSHTDFVDRRTDKAIGLTRLRDELGLRHLPLAAIGDGSCDISTLHQASRAFVPAATLPSYVPGRRQRLVRSRHLGEEALWDAAGRLIRDASHHRRARSVVDEIVFPQWFPPSLRQGPPPGRLGIVGWRPKWFSIRA